MRGQDCGALWGVGGGRESWACTGSKAAVPGPVTRSSPSGPWRGCDASLSPVEVPSPHRTGLTVSPMGLAGQTLMPLPSSAHSADLL